MRYLLILIVIFVLPRAVFSRTPPQESALDGHLHWGKCFIDTDAIRKLPDDLWPIVCVQPKVSSQLIFRDDRGDRNQAMNHARLYTGAHLQRWISLHGEFIAQRLYRLGVEEDVVTDGAKTEDLFMQFGNIAQDKYRAAFGLVDMPFGLDFRPLMEIYQEFIKDEGFWRFPRYGGVVTVDTQVSSQFDVGYATDKLDEDTYFERGGEPSSNEAISARGMFDVSALDGFRFVLSAYGDRIGERRTGVGLVNIARRGDESTFEFVRRRPQPSRDSNFDQLFRFGFRSAARHGKRYVLEYESDRNDYRMGTFGAEFKMPDYGIFKISTSYLKGWFRSQDDYLIVASSVHVAL